MLLNFKIIFRGICPTGICLAFWMVCVCSITFSADTENPEWKHCCEEFDGHKFSSAYKIVESLIQNEPVNREYLIMKGKCLVKMKHVNEALTFFENLSNQFPEDPMIKAEWAVALVWASRIEEAVKMLESVDSLQMSNDFHFLYCKGIVLAASEVQYTEKLRKFLILGLQEAYAQKPSRFVRNFLYLCAQITYQMNTLDTTVSILNKITQDYPGWSVGYIAKATVYLKIDPRKIPSFLLAAEQCPDFNTYRASFYTTKICYDFYFLSDSEAILEDIAKLEETEILNMEIQYLRFLLLVEKEEITIQELEKYLPTCEANDDEEEWLILVMQVNFFKFQQKWQQIVNLLKTNSKFRKTHEQDYLSLLLYAKYMQENKNVSSDEKVFFTKYCKFPTIIITPHL